MRLFSPALILVVLTSSPVLAESVVAPSAANVPPAPVVSSAPELTPAQQEVAGLFAVWNKTLQAGTPEDMANLYAEDGILLPTVSNDVRENRAQIADYFVHFQALKPKGTIDEQHIQMLDANTAVNSGIYTFDVVKDGAPQKVQARYTYVYEKEDGAWMIKNHHSSKMPETMPVVATH